MFQDGGYDAVRGVAVAHFEDALRSPSTLREDFKTTLQEHTQRVHKLMPTYKVDKITGPDHNRRYHVELHLGEKVLAEGRGRSRKLAEQEAAESALADMTASDENKDT